MHRFFYKGCCASSPPPLPQSTSSNVLFHCLFVLYMFLFLLSFAFPNLFRRWGVLGGAPQYSPPRLWLAFQILHCPFYCARRAPRPSTPRHDLPRRTVTHPEGLASVRRGRSRQSTDGRGNGRVGFSKARRGRPRQRCGRGDVWGWATTHPISPRKSAAASLFRMTALTARRSQSPRVRAGLTVR